MDPSARRQAIVEHRREVLLARYSAAVGRWQAVQSATMAGLALALVGFFQQLLSLRALAGMVMAAMPYLFLAFQRIQFQEHRLEVEANILEEELRGRP